MDRIAEITNLAMIIDWSLINKTLAMLVSMIIGRGANNIAVNSTQARAMIVNRRTRSLET